MKLITAYLHHVRVSAVVDALNDAGYRNLNLQDVKGTLKPLDEDECAYSRETQLVISEAKLTLVCEESDVARVVGIIRDAGRIGSGISGWVYVSTLDEAWHIGG